MEVSTGASNKYRYQMSVLNPAALVAPYAISVPHTEQHLCQYRARHSKPAAHAMPVPDIA
eukprot:3940311-Rhodomonas_salina.7